MRKGFAGAIVLAVIIFGGLIMLGMCVEKVSPGYVGVVYDMSGGITGETLSQGWHVVAPTKKVTEYSIGIEQSYLTSEDKGDSPKDESFNIPTSDGKTVRVNLEFSYKFDSEKVTDTFIEFKGRSGEEIKNTFIKPKIVAWTQEVSAKYPVTDIFGDQRTVINAELDVYLKSKFEPYGIIIDTVNFTDISVDEETAAAIQKKVTAQQELELANIEAQTAKIQAEKDREVALIQAEKDKEVALIEAEKNKEASIVQAEQAKIKADGEAEAMRIKAEAEAAANRMIASSITSELIEMTKWESWNGEMPYVTGGATPIINVE